MKTHSLAPLDPLPYFSLEAVKQLIGGEGAAPGTIPTAVYRWMKAGRIIQLKRGLYMSRRFFELHRSDPGFSPAVSAIISPQSYISLEFILQRAGILTEVTYPVTAVTPKNAHVIENTLGTFSYRHIKSSLYSGFTITDYYGIQVAQATPAKALFDFLYLRPWVGDIPNLAEELRLNLDELSPNEQEQFTGYVLMAGSKKMESILADLRKTIWQP